MIQKLISRLRHLLGFTRSGSSSLGRHARRLLPVRHAKQSLGVFLVALFTATYLIHNLANIGGTLAFSQVGPRASVDTRTVASVQVPIKFDYESRGFSWYHAGTDLAAPTGTPVYPIMEGTVEAVHHDYFGLGNHVIVKHDGGYESFYGHLSKTEVSVSQKVGLATEIGLSGSSGFSTGPHLHLEIHQNGQLVNPADFVPGVN